MLLINLLFFEKKTNFIISFQFKILKKTNYVLFLVAIFRLTFPSCQSPHWQFNKSTESQRTIQMLLLANILRHVGKAPACPPQNTNFHLPFIYVESCFMPLHPVFGNFFNTLYISINNTACRMFWIRKEPTVTLSSTNSYFKRVRKAAAALHSAPQLHDCIQHMPCQLMWITQPWSQ